MSTVAQLVPVIIGSSCGPIAVFLYTEVVVSISKDAATSVLLSLCWYSDN